MITGDSKNLLIADDSLFFRVSLGDVLSEAGHRVTSVRNGREAVDAISSSTEGRSFDLLVLDLQMPEMDGFGVLEWLSQNGYSGRLPVLVVTGAYEALELIERLKQSGATGLIQKSDSPARIVHRVNSILFAEKSRGSTARAERAPIVIPVIFALGAREHSGTILNLSASGLFLHTATELLPGAIISLKFALPGYAGEIDARLTVMWSTGFADKKQILGGSGCAFTRISEEDQGRIASFVKAETQRPSSPEQGEQRP